jgi:3-phenylpropionate/trans-cinnamate dioxygenase ferredoxin reductase subunit
MVVVGAGEAGTAAALALRQRGWRGRIVLIGDEVSLPYERPPLSKATLSDPLDGSPKWIATLQQLADARIEFLMGRTVSSVDRGAHMLRLADGEKLAYERLLLATGASPRTLGTATKARVRTLRTYADALAIRALIRSGRSVVVVGGGFIGLEVAASAATVAAAVTVIEAGPRLLMRAVPPSVSAIIRAEHERAGVRIETGVAPVAIDASGLGASVSLADGRECAGDLIVIGIGAVPNTGLAADSALAVDNGIAVDEMLTTADPDIFAAGDCCSFPHALYDMRRVRLEAWRNAQRQGACAAANMLGAAQSYRDVPWFWSDQYGKTLQIAGLCDAGETVIERDFDGRGMMSIHLDRDGYLVAASAFGDLNVVAREIRFAEQAIACQARTSQAELSAINFRLKLLLANKLQPALQ